MRQHKALFIALTIVIGAPCFAQENQGFAQENQGRSDQRPVRFQQFFALQGIEFSKDQDAAIGQLRTEFLPKLAANQTRWNDVLTEQQQQARREAQRKARDDGKEGQALRNASNAALKLTATQRKQRASIQKERDEIAGAIRTRLIALLTDQQRARVQRRRQVRNPIPPTHANIKYGPHERNVMDVWLAKAGHPTPVLISIHGGGFRGGNKSVNADLLRQCLDSGISVVAITYRFSSHAIAPASFHDSARAVQYVRHHAKQWKLDPERFAATGGSAGAGISLWLGFHDDLADPDNADPVLRHSTRLTCMFVNAGQTSYDPRFIRKLFPEYDTYKHGALAQLFDVDLDKLDDLPAAKYRLFEEVSPIHHLTKDDVPAMLSYGGSMDQKVTNVNIGIHHARFGKVLKEKMKAMGIRCDVYAGGKIVGGGKRATPLEFMKQEFGMAE